MEMHTKEEQRVGVLGVPVYVPVKPAGRHDHRLPHEIAAVILLAAYEVVVKQLECERQRGR